MHGVAWSTATKWQPDGKPGAGTGVAVMQPLQIFGVLSFFGVDGYDCGGCHQNHNGQATEIGVQCPEIEKWPVHRWAKGGIALRGRQRVPSRKQALGQ